MNFNINNSGILYINRSMDFIRFRKMEKRFKELDIKFYKRIEAVNGMMLRYEDYRLLISSIFDIHEEKLTSEYWLSRKNFQSLSRKESHILPRVGTMLSHILCLRRALDHQYQSVLILEDDAYLTEDILNTDLEIPEDADIIYFGGTYKHIGEKIDLKDKKIVKIHPSFLKLYGCFGYYIPTREKIKEIYNFLLSQFKDGTGRRKLKSFNGEERLLAGNIDNIFVNHYQKNGNCYFINEPRILHEDDGISTLNNNQVNRYKLTFKY